MNCTEKERIQSWVAITQMLALRVNVYKFQLANHTNLITCQLAYCYFYMWQIVIRFVVVWSHVIGPIVQQHRRTLIGL